MKISEMIEQLERIKFKHGDLPVSVFDDNAEEDLAVTPAVILLYARPEKAGAWAEGVLGVTIGSSEDAYAFADVDGGDE